MKRIFENWLISKKVFAIVVMSIVSLLIFAIISQVCLNAVRINGGYYQNINNGKDLVADILPPPEYIIESYLTANEIVSTNDSATINNYLTKMKSLESDYNTRHKFWMQTLQEGELKKTFTVDSYTPAVNFYKVFDTEFIPAVQKGDKAAEQQLLAGDLKKYYQQNRDAIDKVVTLSNDWSEQNVDSANVAVTAAIICEIAFSLIALSLIIIFGLLVVRSLSRPIKGIVDAANSIADGRLDIELNIQNKDEIGLLAGSFKKIIASLKMLISDSDMLAGAAVEGRLSIRADASKHRGEYQKIIVGVNNTLDALTNPIYIAANTVESLSKGDIPEKIEKEFKGDFNLLKSNINICIDSINNLVADAGELSKAAVEGRLSVRADASKHQGDYRKIIDGLNGTMESVVAALNMAAGTVDRISKGDIPELIEKEYNGDYNIIKNNLNICITSINALIADAEMLSKAAIEGRLSVRADIERHQGDYSKIIMGLNSTIEAVVAALHMAAGTVDKISKGEIPKPIEETYNGDYNLIKENLNICISSIDALVSDANMLSMSAAQGNLSVRADAGRHQGDFQRIILGVNQTLDAVILPLEETISVLGELSRGNLEARVKGDYRGELAALKNTINETLGTLSGYITEIANVLNEVASANLNVEITTEFKGDFIKIKGSINNIVQSLNSMLNDMLGEINTAADEVAIGAQQIYDSSQGLSNGATQQASSVEQLTASVTEIASQARSNAQSSNKAKALAETVRQEVRDGASHMGDLQISMRDINDSSVNISKIIKVIDDIAFQTNVLALNAAIEAARAGKYGKGFSVVADEVRSLAGRSAVAAKDIKDLIENTVGKVANGSELLNETVGQFAGVVEGMNEIADVVTKIDVSSNEQMQGITQVNKGIEQVSYVVQTIAATSEQSAASSGELTGHSLKLKKQLSKFSLK